MSKTVPESPVLELRVALTTDAFERLESFYRDGLGLEPSEVWPEDQGRALVLDMGKATLEMFDETQAGTVDKLKVEFFIRHACLIFHYEFAILS